jgi:RNA polymerase sigma factor (sigma-70 family)
MEPTANSGLKKDWTPNEPAFREFLKWLDQGSESNGERYLEMRHRLVRYFDRKNCIPSDDLADETLNRAARRLEELGQIVEANPAQYCFTVAKFVFLEYVRQAHPQGVENENDFSALVLSHTAIPARDSSEMEEKRLECLEQCLAKLLPEDRDLILAYYQGEQSEKIRRRRELAERLRVTLNALSIRTCRIRARLESCLMQRLSETSRTM